MIEIQIASGFVGDMLFANDLVEKRRYVI